MKEIYLKEVIDQLLANKQALLITGDGIQIINNTISSTLIDDTKTASDTDANKHTYSIAKLGNIISSAYQYQGQKPTYNDLPNDYTAAQKGYVWDVVETNKNYAWAWDDTTNTGHWDDLGGIYIAGTGILIEIGPNGTTISANLANIKIDGTALDITDHAVNLTSKILTIYKANGSTEDVQVVTVPQPWGGVKLTAVNQDIDNAIAITLKTIEPRTDFYYSLDEGLTWIKWKQNNDYPTITFRKTLCVWNKTNVINGGSEFYFNSENGAFDLSGDLTSLCNFNIYGDGSLRNILTYYDNIYRNINIILPNYKIYKDKPGEGYGGNFGDILAGAAGTITLKILDNSSIDFNVYNYLGGSDLNNNTLLFNGSYTNLPSGWTVQRY